MQMQMVLKKRLKMLSRVYWKELPDLFFLEVGVVKSVVESTIQTKRAYYLSSEMISVLF